MVVILVPVSMCQITHKTKTASTHSIYTAGEISAVLVNTMVWLQTLGMEVILGLSRLHQRSVYPELNLELPLIHEEIKLFSR